MDVMVLEVMILGGCGLGRFDMSPTDIPRMDRRGPRCFATYLVDDFHQARVNVGVTGWSAGINGENEREEDE